MPSHVVLARLPARATAASDHQIQPAMCHRAGIAGSMCHVPAAGWSRDRIWYLTGW